MRVYKALHGARINPIAPKAGRHITTYVNLESLCCMTHPPPQLTLDFLTEVITILGTGAEGQLDQDLRQKVLQHEPKNVAETARFLLEEIASHENFVNGLVSTFVLTLCDFYDCYDWVGKPVQDPRVSEGARTEIVCAHFSV